MNAIIAIHPYMTEGVWVFDDAAVGLREEPFIAGADSIIERMVAKPSTASPCSFPETLSQVISWSWSGSGRT